MATSTMTMAETTLTEITGRLVATYPLEQVVLFGSHAVNEPDENSDVDLLVVLSASDERARRRASAGHRMTELTRPSVDGHAVGGQTFTARSERGPMRLTTDQIEAIRQRIQRHMGAHARIWLFGSCAEDSRRGGDVDLDVEPETPPGLAARLRCKSALADALDLNVDLIVQQPGRDLPIYRIAKQSGVALWPKT